MVKKSTNPQSHLIALEPRMMFDGAAVVTAAAAMPLFDGQDHDALTPGLLSCGLRSTASPISDWHHK